MLALSLAYSFFKTLSKKEVVATTSRNIRETNLDIDSWDRGRSKISRV